MKSDLKSTEASKSYFYYEALKILGEHTQIAELITGKERVLKRSQYQPELGWSLEIEKEKESITNKIPKSSRQQQRDGHWFVSIPVLCTTLMANKIRKKNSSLRLPVKNQNIKRSHL